MTERYFIRTKKTVLLFLNYVDDARADRDELHVIADGFTGYNKKPVTTFP